MEVGTTKRKIGKNFAIKKLAKKMAKPKKFGKNLACLFLSGMHVKPQNRKCTK